VNIQLNSDRKSLQTLLVGLAAMALAAFAGYTLTSSALSLDHPLVLGMSGILLVVVLLYPQVGVYILIITLMVGQAYSTIGDLALNRIVGLVALGAILSRRMLKPDAPRLVLGRFDYYVWGLILVSWVSLVVYTGDLASENLRGLIMGYLLYFLLTNTNATRKQFDTLRWVIIIGAVVIAAGSLIEIMTVPIEVRKPRVGGLVQYVHSAAQFSLIAIVVALWLAEDRLKIIKVSGLRQLVLYLLLLLFCATIFISGDRSVFFSLLVAGLVIILSSGKAGSSLRSILLLIIALMLSAQFINSFSPFATRRTLSVIPGADVFFDLTSVEIPTVASGLDTRYLLSDAAWNMFLENPILGVGFNNFAIQSLSYQPLISRPISGHNVFLTTLAETGILGGIFLALMYIQVFRSVLINRSKKDARYILALLISIAIMDAFLHGSFVSRTLFVVFALATIGIRLPEKTEDVVTKVPGE
jgi:O-antigen ligase